MTGQPREDELHPLIRLELERRQAAGEESRRRREADQEMRRRWREQNPEAEVDDSDRIELPDPPPTDEDRASWFVHYAAAHVEPGLRDDAAGVYAQLVEFRDEWLALHGLESEAIEWARLRNEGFLADASLEALAQALAASSWSNEFLGDVAAAIADPE